MEPTHCVGCEWGQMQFFLLAWSRSVDTVHELEDMLSSDTSDFQGRLNQLANLGFQLNSQAVIP